MSEIPRWTPKYLTSWEESGAMSPAVHGGYVDYTDHVAAMQAARPQPMFKVGDRVICDKMLGIGTVDVVMYRDYNNKYEYYFEGRGEFSLWEFEIISYVPPAPKPKFKIGDRVTHWDGSIGVVKFVNLFEHGTSFDVQWHTPIEIGGTHRGKNLTLYVPPTPAKLIPTLKEHEWVRGTYKSTGIAFGPYTVYFNEIGAMFAGDNNLIHWNTGKISDELATLERCDAPEVK